MADLRPEAGGGIEPADPADQALKLSAYGIPLDWIYEGKMGHRHIRAKIRQPITIGTDRDTAPLSYLSVLK